MTPSEAAALLQEAVDRVERVRDSGVLPDEFDTKTLDTSAHTLAYLRLRLDRMEAA